MPSLSELVQARKDAEAASDAADDQYLADSAEDDTAQAAANATKTKRETSRIVSAKAARVLDQAVEAERAALGDIPPEPVPEPTPTPEPTPEPVPEPAPVDPVPVDPVPAPEPDLPVT